jgi:Tol biopolymer transport system component/DNA-binding winged helix-turn-helix (wHTH) protein
VTKPAISSFIVGFDAFEANFNTGELRRNGMRVKLPQQSFQILAMLVEHPGEVVTRERIQARLWSGDTTVEFENSINAAVRRLRRALQDSPEKPRYVETMARLGYRFIAPVHGGRNQWEGHSDVTVFPGKPVLVAAVSGTGDATARNLVQAIEPLPETTEAEVRPFLLPQSLRRKPLAFAIAVVAVVAGFALVQWLVFSSPPGVPGVIRTAQITQDGRVQDVGNIVGDGRRLYFEERIGGHFQLASVNATGGTSEPVPTPFKEALLFDISPDGTQLLVGNFEGAPDESPLWLVPLGGGSPRRLGEIVAHVAVFSGDGRQLAFVNGKTLYLSNSDGTGLSKLATTLGAPLDLRWSPDGRSLRFTLEDADQGGKTSLREVSANGGNPRPVLPDWRGPRTKWGDGESSANWMRGGKYFVFRSARDGVSSIWALRNQPGLLSQRNAPLPLYESTLYFFRVFAAPNRPTLYFTGGKEYRELMRYDNGLHQFVPYLSGPSVGSIGYSRSGDWIAYVTSPQGDLWRSRVDGSQRQQLTFGPAQIAWPQWSPDGKQIAFETTENGRVKIYTVASDGGTAKPLVSGEDQQRFPSWSPDGKSLLFMRFRAHQLEDKNSYSIASVDLQTLQVAELPGSRGLKNPAFSPDGRYVSAASFDDRKLMIFDQKTQTWSELVTATELRAPFWSHDGRSIWYQELFGSEQPIYRIRVADRTIESVATSKQFLRGDVRAYGLIGLAPDDSPIVDLSRATSDIYAVDINLQ